MLELSSLSAPHLADTGVWLWIRDRRFPELRRWFTEELEAGRILVAAPVCLELMRGAPNPAAAAATGRRLSALPQVPCGAEAWSEAQRLQLALAERGDHRRVPVVDLVLAAACEQASVGLLHYDADFERIAAVSGLAHRRLAPAGALA